MHCYTIIYLVQVIYWSYIVVPLKSDLDDQHIARPLLPAVWQNKNFFSVNRTQKKYRLLMMRRWQVFALKDSLNQTGVN
jgi:hypothetical protein